MRRVIGNMVIALCTGYLLCYYSEWMFWSGRALDSPFEQYIATWLVYSFLAYLFLLAVHYFHARSLWAIFLAGAVYGWAGEGILVQTMYDDFPLNISVTALSWHALISVVCGWYLLRQRLRRSTTQALWVSIGLGLYYGFWSSGWWIEAQVETPERQFVYTLVLGIFLVMAYVGLERTGDQFFRPTRLGVLGALGITTAYYALVTIPTQPLALIVLPPVMGFVLFCLYRNRQHETAANPVSPVPVPGARFLIVLLIPVIASMVYALLFAAGFPLQTLLPIYLVSLPAGFLMLLISVLQVLRRRPAAALPAVG